MESQEGKNSNLSDASSAKYDIQVGPALWASCAKNRFFFPVPKQLGRNRVLPGNHGFLSFRHWLLVEPLEWNEIRIPGDLSSPLTRNRLFFCRRLLPNGIIVRHYVPRSSKKTDSSYSSFFFVQVRRRAVLEMAAAAAAAARGVNDRTCCNLGITKQLFRSIGIEGHSTRFHFRLSRGSRLQCFHSFSFR